MNKAPRRSRRFQHPPGMPSRIHAPRDSGGGYPPMPDPPSGNFPKDVTPIKTQYSRPARHPWPGGDWPNDLTKTSIKAAAFKIGG